MSRVNRRACPPPIVSLVFTGINTFPRSPETTTSYVSSSIFCCIGRTVRFLHFNSSNCVRNSTRIMPSNSVPFFARRLPSSLAISTSRMAGHIQHSSSLKSGAICRRILFNSDAFLSTRVLPVSWLTRGCRRCKAASRKSQEMNIHFAFDSWYGAITPSKSVELNECSKYVLSVCNPFASLASKTKSLSDA